MSFWSDSTGQNVAKNEDTSFDMGGGGLLIPHNTQTKSVIDEAKWDAKKDQSGSIIAEYISLRWTVMAPESLKNIKVFQKLWVTDFDPEVKDIDKARRKRDKALKMLAVIDANAGGKLRSVDGKPSDADLQSLVMKPMLTRVMVWEQQDRVTGVAIKGNWIGAVAESGSGQVDEGVKAIAADSPPSRGAGGGGGQRSPAQTSMALDDDIPF